MLTITNQSDYGFLMIGYLRDKKKFIPLSEFVLGAKLPRRFLARISSVLVRKGIIESKEGKTGGYRLARSAAKFTLYDYLKIFEKDVAVTKCKDEKYECPYDDFCIHKSFLRNRLNSIVVNELKKTKLLEVFQ